MLATENSLRKIVTIFAVAALAVFSACTPSGERALLQGDELMRRGRAADAVKKLERARAAMPDEPRMWNLLGLAYHQAGQPQLAAQAYQQALAKDKSNRVAIAHFNLGCLLLEQNQPAAAADHLRSFTLTTNSAAGFVKLATAQLRMRRLDLAEASFGAALRLEPKNVEALNGVGVIHAQRNQRDAIQYFTAALQWNPKYAPAMLNAGLLAQQNPAAHHVALQRFKDYLALAPESPEASSVKLIAQQIEAEFARQAAASNALVTATLKSNALVAALRATNIAHGTSTAPRVVPWVTNARPPAVATKTNEPIAKTNLVAIVTNAPPARPPVASSPPPVVIVAVTNAPPPKPAVTAPAVTTVTAAPPVTTHVPPPAEPVAPEVIVGDASAEEQKKPGFFTRLNPFRSRPKAPAVTNEPPPRVVVLNPQTNSAAPAPKPVFPRYTYLSPAAPAAGNRENAQRAMAQAVKAERAANTNEAWLNYHLAISADPSFFEAQYNAALLAYRLGDAKRALAGFETALALKPDSIDTRYNFALALKQANYTPDAAAELQRVLEAKPNEVRAHLTLANLYAQQLNEPQKARVHYGKVLQLDPRNSQAAVIRYWLAANP